jgi:hypothetical protein
LAVGLVECIITLYEELGQQRDLEDFRKFFGDGAINHSYKAVFPSAKVSGDLEYPHGEATAVRARPKCIRHVIAYEEVDAIGEMDRLFRHFGKGLDIGLDEYGREGKDLPEIGCLCIGLGFNNVTTALSRESNYLFKLRYGQVLNADSERFGLPAGTITDDFIIDSGGAEVHPRELVKDHEDYALIARILHAGRPYLICAGHTADGTAAALKYVARFWPRLLALCDHHDLNSHHMVTVLAHQRDRREPGTLHKPWLAPVVE